MTNKISSSVQGLNPHRHDATWVFLHGWGMHSGIWQPVLAELTRSLRIRTLDLPGFGHSDWQTSDADFNQAVHRLERMLLQSEPGPIHLLGWSMGGLYALALAARKNLNIRGLTLLASSPKFTQTNHWPGIQNNVLAMFQRQLQRDFRATIERFLAVQALGSPHVKQDIRHMRELLAEGKEPHPEALIMGLKWLQEIDLRAEFNQLTCPTLRLYGRLDTLVPVQQAELLHKTNDSYHIFQQSAHTPFLNEPERFVQLIQTFTHSTR